MSAFDAIAELIEMLGIDWNEAATIYLFENQNEQEETNDD